MIKARLLYIVELKDGKRPGGRHREMIHESNLEIL